MRELLLLSPEPLDEEVGDALRRTGWHPNPAGNADQARSLAEENECVVGLAVFPQDADEILLDEYDDIIRRLPRIKWVAALTHRQLERDKIKSLIVDRLYDFQLLPLDAPRISFALGHAYGIARIERELHRRREADLRGRFGLIGASRKMRDLYRMIDRAAGCDVPVLILGATGTGKEQVARAVHAHSSRVDGPFVTVNCAAIPAALMQSELFGYEKGAFTHALERKPGYIEAASGGTLLLDEIGDMPLDLQTSLLRFLDSHLVTPLGGTRAKKVDVRVIAATNKDLRQLVKTKSFRSDLYYRLAVLTVSTPNLKDRGDDVYALADHFLREATSLVGTAATGFGEDALEALRSHAWPGNLRELRNRIFQAALQSEGTSITRGDLHLEHLEEVGQNNAALSLQDARDEAERETLESTLHRNRWNMSRAARNLKISRMTLYRLIEKHGLKRGH
jgi:DNA-binding NtrC family response regulator